MGLNTQNAGALIGSAPKTGTVEIEMICGTYVHSVGRDVNPGEVVTVSFEDANFLVPYNFAKRTTEKSEPVKPEGEQTDEGNGEPEGEQTEEVTTPPAAPQGRRGQRNR